MSVPLMIPDRLMIARLMGENFLQDASTDQSRVRMTAAVGILSFIGCVGFGFMSYGLFVWLRPAYGADGAAAIIGGGALAIVLLAAAVYYAYKAYRWYRIRTIYKRAGALIQNMVGSIEGQLAEPIRAHPVTALALALAAGLLAGRKL